MSAPDTLPSAPLSRGQVYVLAVDLPEPEAKAWAKTAAEGTALAQALHSAPLDMGQVEIIDIADFKGLGLSTYLSEGIGVAEAALAPHRATLDALTGQAMVIRARAWGPDPAPDTHVAPDAPLRMVAHMTEAQAEPPRPTMAPSAAAEGAIGAPGAGEAPASRRHGVTGLFVILGLGLALFALLIFVRARA